MPNGWETTVSRRDAGGASDGPPVDPAAHRRRRQWLVPLSPATTSRPRLVCVPYAGGGTSAYREWGEELADALAVWAVRLPGRESRLPEPPFTEVQPVVDSALDALAGIIGSADRIPYALFGHSMGAVICFELARELKRLGRPGPQRLFVSGRRAPYFPDETPIHGLSPDDFLAAVLRLNGIPDQILGERGLIDLLLPALRADFAVAETYRYRSGPPLDCPITAFGGRCDPTTTIEALDAWRDFTSAGFTLRILPGDHFFINTERAAVLQAIRHDLGTG